MIQGRLNDAAIALHRILDRASIPFGIFGGYAIGSLGGVRESKDIDCLVAVSKEQVIQILEQKVNASHRVARTMSLSSGLPDRSNAVLVEIFCERFPESEYSMGEVPRLAVAVKGLSLGQVTSLFLDPFYLFKGKLRAAATREKYRDAADLRMLVSKYESVIKPRCQELNLEYVGLAVKRYPELGFSFEKLKVDVVKAGETVAQVDLQCLPPPRIGDVQKGLLG